jgi:NAD(P)-dependent dehydrogenase (short-subunit alcohol dehydrogenase family)
MEQSQRDRVVLVTGGANGIGRAIVDAFGSAGAKVVVVDRNGHGAERAATEIAQRFAIESLGIEADVRDGNAVDRMTESALDRFGHIDVLVNNAGIHANTPVLEMDEAEWDLVLNTNAKGMFLVSRAVGKTMVARGSGGQIINMSSGAAESGRVGAAHYCASKAAVKMFTQVLAIELGPHHITVNAIGPGLIDVPNSTPPKEYAEEFVRATPLGRSGKPNDIASVALFLASPAAAFVSGTTIYVDGGWMAGTPLPPTG